MVLLRLRRAALAFLRPRQLLETPVKLLYLPAYLDGIDDHFPVQVRRQVVGYHPFNAAVRGDQLE